MRVFYKKMYGHFARLPKKSGWITRWLYYPGGREAGFWDLFLSSPSGFSQSNETQEVMFMKFFRHERMKLLNSICIYIALSYIICYPKNENEVKIHCAKKRMLVGGWKNGHMQEKIWGFKQLFVSSIMVSLWVFF